MPKKKRTPYQDRISATWEGPARRRSDDRERTRKCGEKKADTIRICKTFANKLWGKDGSKYDQCGMMIWNSHREDILGDDNAWSDDKTAQDGNPVGITPWGDVDGRNGKWSRNCSIVLFWCMCVGKPGLVLSPLLILLFFYFPVRGCNHR